jgi:F0F1-type ATP synthase assembly protein I
MNEEKKELFRNLGMISSMGISVVVAIAIGVYAGLWLDRKFGTDPWFFYIFLFFGIAAGFRNIFIITGREIKRSERDDAGTGKRP